MGYFTKARSLALLASWGLTGCGSDATTPAPTANIDASLSTSGDDTSASPGSTNDGASFSSDTGETSNGANPTDSTWEASMDASVPDDAGPDTGMTADSAGSVDTADAARAELVLPPVNAGLDYQLGGDYTPPDGVAIVSRDRAGAPLNGAYNICYVNGFQVQPGEEDDWEADLLLRDAGGELVIDEDWDEVLLDVGSDSKRSRIAEVVGGWIRQCGDDGFDAVEIDNLDTFSRSRGLLSEDDAVAFVKALADIAHDAGLAIAQKNAVELVSRRDEMGTDFVVAEECNAWSECDGYIDGYGAHVLMIEYAAEDFDTGCAEYGSQYSIVLRDRDLTTPGSNEYVFDGC